MLRVTPLALLVALALPAAAAQAAPVQLKTSAPSAGTLTVEASNPNRYAVRGTATVVAGRRTVAQKAVRIGKRSRAKLTFRVAGAAGPATVVVKTRRAGARRYTTARRAVTLPSPPPAAPTIPTAPTVTPTPAPAGPTRWVGRMGAEGAYDDLELTLSGGQLTVTKPPLVPIVCAENGDDFDTAASLEPFAAPGPWTIGAEGSVVQQGGSLNALAGSSPRSITYKVTETAADATKVTGKLGMSYFWSTFDVFTNQMIFVNCFGSQAFEAVPAP